MDNSIQAHQKELCNKLWAMANALRGNMEAYEFKNYILGMIFYYYLSDRTEKYMANLLKDDNINYADAWADEEYKEAVVEEALRDLGYVIEPKYLFCKMVKMVENRSFDIEFLQSAINSLMESTIGNDSQEDFDGLFSDMQLDSTKLGHTVKDRSAVMAKIIASLDEINFGVEDTKIDVLGNAYEFNLNIPRYVDTFEPEEEIDLNAVAAEIRSIQAEIKDIDAQLKPFFDELGLDFPFGEEGK